MKARTLVVGTMLGVILASGWAWALDPVPHKLNVQGVLRNVAGEVVTGDYDITVSLYPTQNADYSQPLYRQVFTNYHVVGGVFDLYLGPLDNIFKNRSEVWLGLRIKASSEQNWDDELPRVPVTSVAFAYQAEHAEEADNAAVASDVQCSGKCIGAGEVSFSWALGVTPGGDAAGLTCQGCVDSSDVADKAIVRRTIGDHAVGTTQLGEHAVTYTKIAADAVHSDNIKNGEVKTEDLADGAVTSAKLADGAVVASKLGVKWALGVSPGGDAAGLTCTGCVSGGVDNNGNPTGDIGANTIVAGNLADGAVTTTKIADGAVTNSKIQSGAVTNDKIAVRTITGDRLVKGTIGNDELGVNYAGSTSKGGPASDLACANGPCVSSDEVDFNYAASDSKGGAALSAKDVQCSNACVSSDEVSFNYAGSDSKGGPAKNLNCTKCVQGNELDDGAVTDAKVAANANIAGSKIQKASKTNLGVVQISDQSYLNIDTNGILRVEVGYTPDKLAPGGHYMNADDNWPLAHGKHISFENADDTAWLYEASNIGDNKINIQFLLGSTLNAGDEMLSIARSGNTDNPVHKFYGNGNAYHAGDLDIGGKYHGDGSELTNVDATTFEGHPVTDFVFAGCDGCVTGSMLADNTIPAGKLKANAVAGVNIQDGAVTKEKLGDSGCVNGQVLQWDDNNGKWVCANLNAGYSAGWGIDISNNNVISVKKSDLDGRYIYQGEANVITTGMIVDAQVTHNKLATNAVLSDNIQDGQVKNSDLAQDAVTSDKIKDGEVKAQDLADGSVTTTKIANGAVTRAKLAQDGCSNGQVLKWDNNAGIWTCSSDSNTTYSAGTGLSLSGTTFSLNTSYTDGRYVNENQSNSISSSMIKDGTIVNADISSSANISGSKIQKASKNNYGVVKVGSRLSVSNGVINAPLATTSAFGVVKVGAHLSVSNGVLSAPVATSSSVGMVRPGSGLVVDSNGVLSVTGNGFAGDIHVGSQYRLVFDPYQNNDYAYFTELTEGNSSDVNLGLILTGDSNTSHKFTIYSNGTGSSNVRHVFYANGNVEHSGQVTASSFVGNGAGLTNVNAAKLQGHPASDFVRVNCSGCISTGMLHDSSVTAAKIANGAVTNAKLASGAVTGDKMSTSGCSNGQVWKMVNGSWQCANESGTTYTAGNGISISSSHVISARLGSGLTFSSGQIVPDFGVVQKRVSGTCSSGYAIRQIKSDGTVVCEKDDNTTYSADESTLHLNTSNHQFSIKAGGVGTSQLANGAVTRAKLAQDGCSNGQVLKYSSNGWVCASDSQGIVGSGSTNYIPKFTSSTHLGNSKISDNGSLAEVHEPLKVDGTIYWGNSSLTTDQGGAIELKGSSKTPYIDFANSTGDDYDARLMLVGNDELRMYGAMLNVSGYAVRANEFQVQNTNTRLQKGSNNSLRIRTNYGYGDIGPQNSSWFHFSTDRSKFYFNKSVYVDGNLNPYSNGNRYLGDSSHRWSRAYINTLCLNGTCRSSWPGVGGDITIGHGHRLTFDTGGDSDHAYFSEPTSTNGNDVEVRLTLTDDGDTSERFSIYSNSNWRHIFYANGTVRHYGTVYAGGFSGNGSGLTNVNADKLDGHDSSDFVLKNTNAFIKNQYSSAQSANFYISGWGKVGGGIQTSSGGAGMGYSNELWADWINYRNHGTLRVGNGNHQATGQIIAGYLTDGNNTCYKDDPNGTSHYYHIWGTYLHMSYGRFSNLFSYNASFDGNVVPNGNAGANLGQWGSRPDAWYYVYAYHFVGVSDRNQKKDIVDLDNEDLDWALNAVRKAELAFYWYKNEHKEKQGENDTYWRPVPHIGVIAQSLPQEVKAPTGEVIDLTDMIGLSLASIRAVDRNNQRLQKKVQILQKKVDYLTRILVAKGLITSDELNELNEKIQDQVNAGNDTPATVNK